MIRKNLLGLTLVLIVGLAACNGADTAENDEKITEPSPADEVTEAPAEDTTNEEADAEKTASEDAQSDEIDPENWARKIHEIAATEQSPSDKFYELEGILLEYEPSEEKVEQFKTDIVEDYKSGTYLDELDNHERMLTNIFKSYFVEKNNNGAIKEFAFDYNQNLKYAYRGVDSPDSDAVKSNEAQMDKVLPEIE
ncbi:hypothetical protein [Ureibacillus aquaedulcis]|uniref:Uncharacterized protein n=1 Tax=Ureibacillus aquaedulcis TaxID=3058421 RepID=A0ABT8GX12_9BACL|nr:hypothetical protein [Ureibacillus sp. BA0131]MDN4495491.1 hypothetical protein [Ureibacillus sp. BA0131]